MRLCIFALPIVIGAVLDTLFGDPYTMPHPIRLIGKIIAKLEQAIRGTKAVSAGKARLQGMLLAVLVLLFSTGIPVLILYVCYHIHVVAGILAEGIFCYYLVAAKCLKDESMKVYDALSAGSIRQARQAVSMIVGRDTKSLDTEGIIKAAVETVAENTSDGVTAPLFYMALGGACLGFFYKAVNTMDSMIGYRNDRYMYFGTFAARLDDVLNYIPSRLTALLMILAAYILRLDGKNAYRIWHRDRRKHKSPNSAQTEAVCAGALDVSLAGDAYYFGKLYKKDRIGDDIRKVENEDIKRANRLMYVTAGLMLVLVIAVRLGIGYLFL